MKHKCKGLKESSNALVINSCEEGWVLEVDRGRADRGTTDVKISFCPFCGMKLIGKRGIK